MFLYEWTRTTWKGRWALHCLWMNKLVGASLYLNLKFGPDKFHLGHLYLCFIIQIARPSLSLFVLIVEPGVPNVWETIEILSSYFGFILFSPRKWLQSRSYDNMWCKSKDNCLSWRGFYLHLDCGGLLILFLVFNQLNLKDIHSFVMRCCRRPSFVHVWKSKRPNRVVGRWWCS